MISQYLLFLFKKYCAKSYLYLKRFICAVPITVFFIISNVSCGLNYRLNIMSVKEPHFIDSNSVTKFDLSTYFINSISFLEFDVTNNEQILFGSLIPQVKTFYGIVGESYIFDYEKNNFFYINNKLIFKNNFKKKFPKIYNQYVHRKFIANQDGWGISKDGQNIVTLNKKNAFTLGGSKWDLCFFSQKNNEQKLTWSLTLSKIYGFSPLVDFFTWKDQDCIIVAFVGEDVRILSQQDGKTINQFAYEPINTDLTRSKYREKHNLWFADNVELNYSVGCVAFEPNKNLLVTGDTNSKRVRVININKPNDLLIELNTNAPPNRPWGGNWSVRNLRFASQGKYLIIEYNFMGRYTSKVFEPTEIYSVNNWELCWSENKQEIHSVTVSPDGKKLALINNMILEIGLINGKAPLDEKKSK